ncbi:MAG: alpha-ketoacid dehydrogenase subunit beta, partial [Gammaproteobacteria bacterium]|nr:alpha-ketoacid dehydrogenase subunit beta [Gammaproteobacteria bacterium]
SDLLAPVQRVTGYDTIMPYFQLEKEYIPTVKRIKTSVLQSLE